MVQKYHTRPHNNDKSPRLSIQQDNNPHLTRYVTHVPLICWLWVLVGKVLKCGFPCQILTHPSPMSNELTLTSMLDTLSKIGRTVCWSFISQVGSWTHVSSRLMNMLSRVLNVSLNSLSSQIIMTTSWHMQPLRGVVLPIHSHHMLASNLVTPPSVKTQFQFHHTSSRDPLINTPLR